MTLKIINSNDFCKVFPDGQKIAHIDINLLSEIVREHNMGNVITIKFLWSWENLQILIGVVAILKSWGVDRFVLKIPYLFGSRADRQFDTCEPHYLKQVIAPIINSLGAFRVYSHDVHSDVAEACIDNFTSLPRKHYVEKALQHLKEHTLNNRVCLVVPDAGAVKKSHEIDYLFQDVVFATKYRVIETGEICYIKLDKLSDTHNYLIVDDICDGGATFLSLANEIRKHDPFCQISLYVTHGIFSKGLDRLRETFKFIYTTNSVRPTATNEHNVIVFDLWNK